jgi:hypothetical protein
MPTYSPTDANFLTVAQSRTNNGQKDVRVILDISTNIFYTLDDDGNFIEIQSSGGGQDLAGTLVIGNFSDGTDIILDDISNLVIATPNDVGMKCDFGNNTSKYMFVDDGSGNSSISIVVEDINSLANVTVSQTPTNYEISNTNNLLIALTDDNKFRTKSFSKQTDYRLANGSLTLNEIVGGEITDFNTTGAAQTLLVKVVPGVTITRVKAHVKGLKDDDTKGYYAELTGAFLFSGGSYVSLGTISANTYSNFSTASSTIVGSGTEIQVKVTGEAATKIYWECELLYSTY